MLVWVSINKNMADSQVDPINVPLAVQDLLLML